MYAINKYLVDSSMRSPNLNRCNNKRIERKKSKHPTLWQFNIFPIRNYICSELCCIILINNLCGGIKNNRTSVFFWLSNWICNFIPMLFLQQNESERVFARSFATTQIQLIYCNALHYIDVCTQRGQSIGHFIFGRYDFMVHKHQSQNPNSAMHARKCIACEMLFALHILWINYDQHQHSREQVIYWLTFQWKSISFRLFHLRTHLCALCSSSILTSTCASIISIWISLFIQSILHFHL